LQINYATLENCHAFTGTVVVIDVCRAFTTAAFAFAAGAQEVLLVSAVEEAFTLREGLPDALIMGEVGGLPVEGFDFGNSPSALIGADLTGRRLIQRTSAGTQGVVRSQRADVLLTSSFVVAGATARYVRQLAPESVTLVMTGWRDKRPAEEDAACAEYLAALLAGQTREAAPFLDRAQAWPPAQAADQSDPVVRRELRHDLACCLELDRFDFAMRVERREGLLVMRPVAAPAAA
jgi:2-phosphosulfolactate phosphatase